MRRSTAVRAAPLLLLPALAGCSATPSPSPSTATTQAPTTAATQTSTTAPAQPGSGSGVIKFHGKVSGTMTMFVCHDGAPAQLNVAFDGQDKTYAGLIDADDFTFVAPSSTGYTLADGASKPQVSGKTYTVKGTKLVGITNDDTVTADGSVTCP